MPREIAYNWLDRAAGQTVLSAEEALFVLRLQANEDAAYDELVRTYNASIFHVAYRMLGDRAESSDLVQEIFLKVFRNIGGFKGEAALKTWIFRIAFSEILNRLRWWKRRRRFESDARTGLAVEGTRGCHSAGSWETLEGAPVHHRASGYRRVLL